MAEERVIFTWEGKNSRGEKVKGETHGISDAAVKAELRKQGILPLKVRKKPQSMFSQREQKIVTADIAIFSRQLATMMEAGVPLVQSFDIVGKGHENPTMQKLIMSVKADIEGGDNLADALAKHPEQFDDLFVNLTRAGEQAGALETMLDKLAIYKEKSEALKSKIKSAMFYPVAVLVVSFIVTAILLIFVVPQFEELFSGLGADLPAFTKMVVDLSETFQEYWYIVFGVPIGLNMVFNHLKKTSVPFNHSMDRLTLKLPVLGPIIEMSATARFARTLATMSAAGVPLVEAMTSVAKATGNIVYEEATIKMRDDAATGMQLQQSMRSLELFPNMMVQMVAIGEESGALEKMLDKVADIYEEEVDNLVDGLTSMMEPLIMAFLGVVVGGLVVAMYLPIFKMGDAI